MVRSSFRLFDNDSLQGNNIDADLLDQHFAIPNAVNQIYEYGGDLGGPIVKDRAWIWGAYRKQDIQTHPALELKPEWCYSVMARDGWDRPDNIPLPQLSPLKSSCCCAVSI